MCSLLEWKIQKLLQRICVFTYLEGFFNYQLSMYIITIHHDCRIINWVCIFSLFFCDRFCDVNHQSSNSCSILVVLGFIPFNGMHYLFHLSPYYLILWVRLIPTLSTSLTLPHHPGQPSASLTCDSSNIPGKGLSRHITLGMYLNEYMLTKIQLCLPAHVRLWTSSKREKWFGA